MRIWHLALIAAAFGTIAAGSCAEFVVHGPFPASDGFAIAFVLSGVLTGGPLVLLGFRLRVDRRQAWPSIRQMLLVGIASWLVAHPPIGAFFLPGIALTVGAPGLLARAANGPHSNP